MSLQTEVTRLQGIKGDIQTALVNKGVSGAGSHTMSQFATDIAGISTGTDVSDTTATASDVLSGKAFYLANGTKANGSIASKSSSDLTVSGATIYTPSGYYPSQASKSVSTGSLSTPTISGSGLITASVGNSGYLQSGASATMQLSTQSANTITPTTYSQTAVSSGKYTTGTVTVSGDSNLVASNIKSGVSIFGVNGSYSGGGYQRLAINSITRSDNTIYINVPSLTTSMTLLSIVGIWKVLSVDTSDGSTSRGVVFSGDITVGSRSVPMFFIPYNNASGLTTYSTTPNGSVSVSNGYISFTLNGYVSITSDFTKSTLSSSSGFWLYVS